MTLKFYPVRDENDVLKDLIENKNRQSVLKIEESKLIDELVDINRKETLNDKKD
jgi:hypothetical protein|tara:strand:- start:3625 stop:3786 length:162 start_codon:yes stop_codon:yes gene_type:complete